MLNAFSDQKKTLHGAYCLRSDSIVRPVPNAGLQGKKGANLLELLNLGIATPKFLIFTTELFNKVGLSNIDLEALLEQVMLSFPDFPGQISLAARSSGIETMPGIYETRLAIRSRDDLKAALQKAYASWDNPVAVDYRARHGIAPESGLALIVQEMVYGDAGEMSGSGAFYTRDMQTGENKISGTYHLNARGDETMTGSAKEYRILNFMNVEMDFGPEAVGVDFFAQFTEIKNKLEKNFRRPQEVEFTVERGKLYILQTRDAEIPDFARQKIMADMFAQGLITVQEVTEAYLEDKQQTIYKLNEEQLRQDNVPLGVVKAESLSPGVVAGRLAFSLAKAGEYRRKGDKVILVVPERTQEYLQALNDGDFDGLLTFYGNRNMHDARIARERGIPGVAVLGGRELKGNLLYLNSGYLREQRFAEGSFCTLDGWADVLDRGRLLAGDYSAYRKPFGTLETAAQKINVAEITAKVREYFARTPVKEMVILHSIMRAMVEDLQNRKKRPDQTIELDIALNALHGLLKEQEKSAEQLNLLLYKLYRGFANQQTGFAIPQSVDEWLAGTSEMLAQVYARYGGLNVVELDYCDYLLSKGGHINFVAYDRELPLSFSVLFAGNPDLSGINFDLLAFVQELKLYFHYVGYDEEWLNGRRYEPTAEDWSVSEHGRPNSDLPVTKFTLEQDKMDPHKMRVSATVELPKPFRYLQSSFYLEAGGGQVWLKTAELDERLIIAQAPKSNQGFYELLLANDNRWQTKQGEYIQELLNEVQPASGGSPFYYSREELAKLIAEACKNWHFQRLELGGQNADGTLNTIQNISDEKIYDWRTLSLFKLIDLFFPNELTIVRSEQTVDFPELGEGWTKVFSETRFSASPVLQSRLADTLYLLQKNNVCLDRDVLVLDNNEDLQAVNLDNLGLYIYKCLAENVLHFTPENLLVLYSALIPEIVMPDGNEPLSAADWQQKLANQCLESSKVYGGEVWQDQELLTHTIINGYGAHDERHEAADFVYKQLVFTLAKMHYRNTAYYFQTLFGLSAPEYAEAIVKHSEQGYGHDSHIESNYQSCALLVSAEFKAQLALLLAKMSQRVPASFFYEEDSAGQPYLSLVKIAQAHIFLSRQPAAAPQSPDAAGKPRGFHG
ncbi:MAG: hypothetical protein LBD99_05675 [Candidatus Margulisbacteria bacterium]|jgi:hypothetical protein|nr:hypothetical protein [Candidatus Margulisiibacteriota bacterium]